MLEQSTSFDTKAYHAAWYKAHRAEQLAKASAYNLAHRVEISAYRAARHEAELASGVAYRNSHREQRAAYAAAKHAADPRRSTTLKAAYRAVNPERERAYQANYYSSHREKKITQSRAYRAVNPERVKRSVATWAKANPEKVVAIQHVRRARLREVESEQVLVSVLFERDKGICGICGKRVYKNARDKMMRPSHDHILPVSHGGANTYANSQLSHLRCNVARGNRGKAQLRLNLTSAGVTIDTTQGPYVLVRIGVLA